MTDSDKIEFATKSRNCFIENMYLTLTKIHYFKDGTISFCLSLFNNRIHTRMQHDRDIFLQSELS